MVSNDFLDFSLSRTGIMTTRYWGAYFKLKSDIRHLFPYLNATITDARFHERPEYMRFLFEGINCTLYPNELIASPFVDRDAALAFFKRFMVLVAELDHRRDAIQPNYRKYNPPAVMDILRLLPRSNCKKCGHATCIAFAAALRNNETTPDQCIGFAKPISIRKVYPVLDGKGNLTSTISFDFDVPENLAAVLSTPDDDSKKETNRSGHTAADKPTAAEDDPGAVEPYETIDDVQLTCREVQVLELLANGSTNTQIATTLGISPHTVKSHVIHIFNKLGVNDRIQAAVWLTRLQLKNRAECLKK